MDEISKRRAQAAGKIAIGAVCAAMGVATATGHGALGGFLRSHHMMRHAVRFGAHSVKEGSKTVREGLEDWKRS